jgi:tryptophan synthase beta chain
MFGIDVRVYMVKVSYEQKPFRRSMMETWGAEVLASPTGLTESGRKILAEDPASQGSLGIAISEAVEEAATHDGTNYALGSVLNHVCLPRRGDRLLRWRFQLRRRGLSVPRRQGGRQGGAPGRRRTGLVPDADPRPLRLRLRRYRRPDDFMPPGIHAGGLRYHGDSPLVSQLHQEGIIEAVAVPQLATFEAGVQFARCEGIIPAPESCHAIRAALDEALACKERGEPQTILFNLSGHGHFDMAAYDSYFAGRLEDFAYPEAAINAALEHLPKVG